MFILKKNADVKIIVQVKSDKIQNICYQSRIGTMLKIDKKGHFQRFDQHGNLSTHPRESHR